MTILAGPNGKNHEALQLTPLLSLVTSKGGSVAVLENKALAGVERLFTEQLVAAMDVWDLQERGQHGQAFWVARRTRTRAENSFTFDAITPKSRTEVRITGNGAALTMEFPSDLSGLPRSAAKLPRGTYRLEIDPSIAIAGFLILRGTAEAAVVYLALPTAHTEMLGASHARSVDWRRASKARR